LKHTASRIARIEACLPNPTKASTLGECIPYWTSDELIHLLTFLEAGKPIPIYELAEHVVRALNRKIAGANPMGSNTEAAQASFDFWRFPLALGNRHGPGTPGCLRFGALDLTLREIDKLVQLAATARTIDEIEVAAHIIERLRLDGAPMTVSQFADLVIHGKSTTTL
jgi:hypothetical protein